VSYVVREFLPSVTTTTVIQTPNGKWKKELKGVSEAKFSNNNRELIYLKNDSLCFLTLGSSQCLTIPNIQKFQLLSSNNSEWLLYQEKSTNKELIVRDMLVGKEQKFQSVNSYSYKQGIPMLVLLTILEDKKESQLKWINLKAGKQVTIWSEINIKPDKILFDETGRQIVFITGEKGKQILWHYKDEMEKAQPLARDGEGALKKMEIGAIENFSKDGNRLFFNNVRRDEVHKPSNEPIKVTIWSTKDLQLQSVQDVNYSKSYYSVVNLNTQKIIQLQKDFEQIAFVKNEEYCIARHYDSVPYDYVPNLAIKRWPASYRENSILYLVSLKDGSRTQLPWKHINGTMPSEFSPNGKYILYWDGPTLNYYCYEIATGTTRNISSKIDVDLNADAYFIDPPVELKRLAPPAAWLVDDEGVLIYDYYDIWLLDPLGKAPPKNITNGLGRRNKTIFRLSLERNKRLIIGEKLILAALNERTKENGHYVKILGGKGDPLPLHIELPLYCYSFYSGSDSEKSVKIPIKARDKEAYLVIKESTTSFPNYYFTSNLKDFIKVSDIHPESKYNWITSELHAWTAADRDTLQGVLYKPENFDPSKKYPVLFLYYEEYSSELNHYWTPEWTTGRINIPFFVSQGYLVFTPDIHYRFPYLRQSILNSVVSAANYVSKLPFVDSTKMGIEGHSFGGFETGHLVSGTDIFSAAVSACGYYDLISDAGTLMPSGLPRNVAYQKQIGSLWDHPKDYVENSPIFYVDKIKTPLLLIAGEHDGQVPYDQSTELFLALNNLRKISWMLSYDDDHVIDDNNHEKDYTIRLLQFFDHYLKETPPPKWMTVGIPAKLKMIESGYELDLKGKCSNDCKVCKGKMTKGY
jgi:dipeptidyl aminopeptidase/acylaminoacyl peptidase